IFHMLYFLLTRLPPRSPLFPYTTLFRSISAYLTREKCRYAYWLKICFIDNNNIQPLAEANAESTTRGKQRIAWTSPEGAVYVEQVRPCAFTYPINEFHRFSMEALKTTTFQASLFWENIDKNLSHLSLRLSAIREKTDLIVLPEMFNTGFTMNVKECAEKP